MMGIGSAWRWKEFADGGIAMHTDSCVSVRLNPSALWLVQRLTSQEPDDAICLEYAQVFGVNCQQAARDLEAVRDALRTALIPASRQRFA